MTAGHLSAHQHVPCLADVSTGELLEVGTDADTMDIFRVEAQWALPLYWDSGTGVFLVEFCLGGVPVPLRAALDTGSSRVVVSADNLQQEPREGSESPKSEGGAVLTFDGAPVPSIDPRSGEPCTSRVVYVSQTSQVTTYQFQATFPLVHIGGHGAGFDASSGGVVGSHVAGHGHAAVCPGLHIPNFPIGVAHSSTNAPDAHPPVNVFGMCPSVAAATFTHAPDRAKPARAAEHTALVLSSCELAAPGTMESAFLRHLQDADTTPRHHRGVCWSVVLFNDGATPSAYEALAAETGTDGDVCTATGTAHSQTVSVQGDRQAVDGLVILGYSSAHSRVLYTPMVESLPHASSASVRSPFRYYVIRVTKCVLHRRFGTKTLPFPTFMIVDTGTTQGLLPETTGGKAVKALNSLTAGMAVTLELAGGATLRFEGTSSSSNKHVHSSMWETMGTDVVKMFDTTMDTGILGCLAMRGFSIHFDLQARRLGFQRL